MSPCDGGCSSGVDVQQGEGGRKEGRTEQGEERARASTTQNQERRRPERRGSKARIAVGSTYTACTYRESR